MNDDNIVHLAIVPRELVPDELQALRRENEALQRHIDEVEARMVQLIDKDNARFLSDESKFHREKPLRQRLGVALGLNGPLVHLYALSVYVEAAEKLSQDRTHDFKGPHARLRGSDGPARQGRSRLR